MCVCVCVCVLFHRGGCLLYLMHVTLQLKQGMESRALSTREALNTEAFSLSFGDITNQIMHVAKG